MGKYLVKITIMDNYIHIIYIPAHECEILDIDR